MRFGFHGEERDEGEASRVLQGRKEGESEEFGFEMTSLFFFLFSFFFTNGDFSV